jgi:exodeoxyribonuclease VIII
MQAGIYYTLSNEDYHDDPAISRSGIMEFKKNPRKYWAKYLNPNRPPKEKSSAMEFGTAFHTLLLEPHLLSDNYFIHPEQTLLKEIGRERYDDYKYRLNEAETLNKSILTYNQFENLLNMQESLYANEKAKELIEGAIYESSYFAQDKESGLMIKAKPDILHRRIYVDLKTCENASASAFQRDMVSYGNHIQAAMVKDAVLSNTGHEIYACINICVEKTYPYSVGIYIIDEAAIDAGREQYKAILLDLQACLRHNKWPDYETQTIGLPRWAT